MADKQATHPEVRTKSVAREFNLLSFVWRLLFSLLLVLATYNPSGTSFFHWVTGAENLGPLHLVAGLLLLAGWTILWVATWRALDTFGVLLAAAAIGAIVWLMIDLGLFALESSGAIAWVVLISVAVLLAIGLSWAHVWRRLTGQFEVDDAD